MSSVVISGDTSGAITLSAPAVAGTNTITLPASTGTVVTTGTPASGNVIQVVNATYSTTVSTTSSSFVTTGLSATITPKFSTSKIYVISTMPISCSASNEGGKLTIYRNGSNIAPNTGLGSMQTSASIYAGLTIQLLDSPATTSATTYTIYGSATGGITVTFNSLLTGASSVITLMEVAA